MFFSSRFFYDFLSRQELAGKRMLEIGCGSGLLSLLACRLGAQVTAVDIHPRAVECTRMNFVRNFGEGHSAVILESDLFSAVPEGRFDVIIVNPPYYFRDARLPEENAWLCGTDGRFFTGFFSGLGLRMAKDSCTYMVLAEVCDIRRIGSIAGEFGYGLEQVESRDIRFETSFIFRIQVATTEPEYR